MPCRAAPQSLQLVLGYIGHNLALLAAPVALAALALAWRAWWRLTRWRRDWVRGANASVNASQALNVWIIQIVVAIGPPLGALIFTVYMKTDWGISLFFLAPLALVAIPCAAPARRSRCFISPRSGLVITLAALAASPYIATREMARQSQRRFELRRALRTRPRTDASLA